MNEEDFNVAIDCLKDLEAVNAQICAFKNSSIAMLNSIDDDSDPNDIFAMIRNTDVMGKYMKISMIQFDALGALFKNLEESLDKVKKLYSGEEM